MFELLNVGLEMQKRMIDIHMQGIEAAQELVETAQQNVDASLAATPLGNAGANAVKGWMRFWGLGG
ncbi:hypothetical protein L288_00030 [Sphingobium quisquiliarum P25]|uniref:Phasin domain-containing protein n=1 Tax=Sphingobium quisquiliarum P25 TaxID=1329909 RepID=T0HTU2_9SPHN|nr:MULTISPECIES: hypothetical protein [Sphingobium]EQB15558.1 hypothetical protein L288_00030 [Sphingobium quisquiliarum P25]EZP72677.1 hypothetical protein BV96_01308 [Sphingomonas paucimobilis]